ncbi:MAG: hypothetical protein MJ071_07385 [Oscillospiraceae bacterium]|nr:hypothetical protein [Oscillospiraceae bacterium]
MNPSLDEDELAALLDQLMSSGVQHVQLRVGEETRVQTINSQDCGMNNTPCCVPNFDYVDKEQTESDDDD